MGRTVEIHTYFNPPPPVDTVVEGESLTQQHFKDECDVNNIIARYVSTGLWCDPLQPPSSVPVFGDFSSAVDFQAAQNMIAAATQAFYSLPASLRARFANDPAKLLAFLEDDSNREEAIRLGLVEDKKSDHGSSGNVPAGQAVGDSTSSESG